MTDPNRVSFAPGTDRNAALAQAAAILRRDGVVVLDHLIDPARLARCHDEIAARYPDMAQTDRTHNYGPYEKRHCMPMVVEGGLADPDILLPKPISRLAAEFLEPDYKVDSVGLLVAAPGAPDQVAHRDAWLFPRQGVDHLLPPYAIAMATPLVTMDETSGRTAFWRRSHRVFGDAPETSPDYVPVVEPGSVLLWDFRVYHGGRANRGPAPRPVIFTVLSRRWWVEIDPPEARNYRKLQVARSVFDTFKPRWQARFSRAAIVEP